MAEVETTRDGAVLTITLNRPDVLNAFNADMHRALAAALKEARAPEVRAVLVTGAGRGFCVGQDLTEFREAPGDIGSRLRGNYPRTSPRSGPPRSRAWPPVTDRPPAAGSRFPAPSPCPS